MFEYASVEHPDYIERTLATTLEEAEAAEAAVLAAIKDVEETAARLGALTYPTPDGIPGGVGERRSRILKRPTAPFPHATP